MNEKFQLNALSIGEYQSCRRKFLLSSDYMMARWRPKSLFDACLRRAIFLLSSGHELKSITDEAKFHFMQLAADPGLDTSHDPYCVAKDYCAMLDTILTYLSKTVLLKLEIHPVVELTSTTEWKMTSFRDESGQLHRWMTVSRWDKEDLAKELHSWLTIGDIVISRSPMMLHIIEVGEFRSGRPQCAWARGYRHPTMPTLKLRFKRTQGQDFKGWHPVWLSEVRHDVSDWVGLMLRDGVTDDIVHHITVNVPSESVCDSAIAQITSEAMAMREMIRDKNSLPYDMFPMSRNACDGYVPCNFQNVCYVERPVDIQLIGLYKNKSQLVNK